MVLTISTTLDKDDIDGLDEEEDDIEFSLNLIVKFDGS